MRRDKKATPPQIRRGRPPRGRATESGKKVAVEEQRRQEVAASAAESVEQRAAAQEPVEKQRQEEDGVLEHAKAVPIGKPVMVTGKRGKMQRKHYASFEHNGLTFDLEDSVLITPETDREKPYVAIIKAETFLLCDIIETEGSLRISGQWFYRPEEAEIGEGKFCAARDTRELFYSFHVDDVPAESVMHKCIVHFIPQNKQIPARKKYPGFIVQNVYGAAEKKLWNITDKEYDENMRSQINILLKKTIDRIGELPNLEPLCNKDVNVVDVTKEPQACKPKKFLKAEAPAISEQNNYAILARYNAITGVETRDSWLDKLLESIPLASSKETAGRVLWDDLVAASKTSNNLSSAEITDSNDNENLYGLDNVIPIIVALERCAYEAFCFKTDFRKYNHKMRHLWYNIKDSSELRRRLMEKELDPQVLLTMSPDELKAGLSSAEKTSEPEQRQKLQVIDARCPRCQEKKVGTSDTYAGHRDHYQLECTSCGHTWFSSSLSAEGHPSSARVIGNTVVGATAAGEAAHKKRQHPKSGSRLVR